MDGYELVGWYRDIIVDDNRGREANHEQDKVVHSDLAAMDLRSILAQGRVRWNVPLNKPM